MFLSCSTINHCYQCGTRAERWASPGHLLATINTLLQTISGNTFSNVRELLQNIYCSDCARGSALPLRSLAQSQAAAWPRPPLWTSC